MFHRFNHEISKQELPGQFTCPFFYVPHPLVVEAAGVVQEYLLSRPDWADEIGQGKMFGVLVVVDDNGAVGFLAAYSGNIANRNDYPFLCLLYMTYCVLMAFPERRVGNFGYE